MTTPHNEFSLAPSPERKQALMDQVYNAYLEVGPAGATREEVYAPLGIKTQTGHPICTELVRVGKLVRTGRRGLSRLGRPAEILIADVYASAEEKGAA